MAWRCAKHDPSVLRRRNQSRSPTTTTSTSVTTHHITTSTTTTLPPLTTNRLRPFWEHTASPLTYIQNPRGSYMMASFFSYFGGGGAAKRNNASKEAIVKLRQQLEMLRKREIHMEKQMQEQDAIAKKNITSNKTGRPPTPSLKPRTLKSTIFRFRSTYRNEFRYSAVASANSCPVVARAALKRKKVLEQNLITAQQHINTLEQQMNAVETANLNLETIKVMKEASDAMKGMNKRVGIADVDETMCVYLLPTSRTELSNS